MRFPPSLQCWFRCSLLVVLLACCRPLAAQRFRQFQAADPTTPNPTYDGRFMLGRLKFTTAEGGYYYRGLPAWAHGYDLAERNLLDILNVLSTVHPRHGTSAVFGLDDPELFRYPVVYMAEADFWVLTDKEALAFRKYLLKGGFVIFDDFRDPGRFGGGGWEQFAANMHRVLPELHAIDMKISDPIFHGFYEINTFSIVPQSYDGGAPVFRGFYEDNDPSKRLLAMINYNTDVSDFWEFSGTGLMPIAASNEAYKLGVNYIMYALTH
jgi:hypothetical protein